MLAIGKVPKTLRFRKYLQKFKAFLKTCNILELFQTVIEYKIHHSYKINKWLHSTGIKGLQQKIKKNSLKYNLCVHLMGFIALHFNTFFVIFIFILY